MHLEHETGTIKLDGNPDSTPITRRFRRLAFVTAGLTYALILLGGVVRIMGAGMACGDDWPLCDGRILPPLELAIWLEWGHRLDAALVSLFVVGLAAYGIRHRRDLSIAGGRAWVWAVVAAVVLILQVAIGAATVKLELPTGTVVLHLALASILLGILLIAGLSTRPAAILDRDPTAADTSRHGLIAAGAGFTVLLFGGLVANSGAAPLCQGFPLCNGQWVPEGAALVHLHWTHRLLAYVLVGYLGWAAFLTLRSGATRPVRAAVMATLVIALVQVGAGAAMVLSALPTFLRAAHLALGVALWAALVVWAVESRRAAGHRTAPVPSGRAMAAPGLAGERPT